jgi:hypothetical protein
MTQAWPAERTAVRTADFEEAVENLRLAFGDVDLRRAESGASRFAMQTFRLPDVISTRWTFSGVTGGSRVDDDGDSVLLTGAVLGGTAHIWSPSDDVDTTRPFLYPDVADSELGEPTSRTSGSRGRWWRSAPGPSPASTTSRSASPARPRSTR